MKNTCHECGRPISWAWVGRTLRAVDAEPCHQINLFDWVYPFHRCGRTGCHPRRAGCIEVENVDGSFT